ncbi:RNA polymerase sigma factor SigI [Bacillus sp. EB600]|uniref:RNA polymerase sigma factor SigI n=1 Tax=Bacillus sp. EB600 TaxID=2806345 RepID=UPI00210B0AD3|nr:RNA polymerase sigma factor SigI [Bacillus sp. EB600]MCQ6279868.1 RNA polymerase sigma factor SigI [Bacillus sp. EB600]
MKMVLGLLFMAKKKKKTLEESVMLIQQGDQFLLNELIASYKPFIAKTVSSVCKRYIHETDDEFSIGLIAFNEAIEKYLPERGKSLLSFAEVLIRRRVIDYIRKQTKHQHISYDFNNTAHDDESPGTIIVNELSYEEYKKKTEEEVRKEEIVHFQALLRTFDLSFNDLVDHSPKHADARKNAIMVAKILAENEELQKLLLEKKRLPIKQLEEMVDVSRKTIERNRKYIIAIALILLNDYLYLKDYIKGVLEI